MTTPSSWSTPTLTWSRTSWGRSPSPSSTAFISSIWPTTSRHRASTCWTPASSPTGTAPPIRWLGWPTACGTSGDPGCSPSWSTPSRASTNTTATRTPGRTSSSPSWTGHGCCPTGSSATGCCSGWPTPTSSAGGAASSWTGPAPSRPRPSLRCRPGWAITPRRRRRAPSWGSAAPPWTSGR